MGLSTVSQEIPNVSRPILEALNNLHNTIDGLEKRVSEHLMSATEHVRVSEPTSAPRNTGAPTANTPTSKVKDSIDYATSKVKDIEALIATICSNIQ